MDGKNIMLENTTLLYRPISLGREGKIRLVCIRIWVKYGLGVFQVRLKYR